MPVKLVSTAGDHAFELSEGATLVVGRGSSSDIPLLDPTISRRHAEIAVGEDERHLRDLGSSNGTFVNGERIESAPAHVGDIVAFGNVPFRVTAATPRATPRVTPVDRTATVSPAPALVRARAFDAPTGLLSSVFRAHDLAEVRARGTDGSAVTERRLALLLEVAKGLSRAPDVDALLDTITQMVFQIMDVDRVAIELVDERGERVPKLARDRHGVLAGRIVPQSIARRVAGERVAVLSHNAPEDERFGGASIVQASVRSAMCAPLVGSDDAVLGVLYVDNLTTIQRFGDEDLDFLVAFSNIAAVALENSRLAERIRREALVRSNFERFFAPSLAARITGSADQLRLGGDKRTVVVLFSDIRGFTAMSEGMTPAEVATLLSEYFTEMVEIVFRHGGTLDKFIGDAVMAQWGAPIGSPDDADRAMAAAIEMIRALRARGAARDDHHRPELQVGIGLNFGEAFAGYIGSDRRLEFTVIGDAVNVASRLCEQAHAGEILLTEQMRSALHDPPPMRERGTMELRGKSQSVPVYSVVP